MLIIVPCTKRKLMPPDEQLQFGTLPSASAQELARIWSDRAERVSKKVPASDLYCGPAWTSVERSLNQAKEMGEVRLKILSAGFGLVDPTTLLPSYSATFSSDEDRVSKRISGQATTAQKHSTWWLSVNRERRQGKTPLASIVRECSTNSPVVIAAGAHYLEAVQDDLSSLSSEITSDKLFVISAGLQRRMDWVAKCQIPIDLRLEQLLPGPRTTINLRALEWVLSRIVPATGWDRQAINQVVLHELASVDMTTREEQVRSKLTESELANWIRERLSERPEWKCWPMLQTLRVTHSCEQARFRAAWQHAKEEMAVSRQ